MEGFSHMVAGAYFACVAIFALGGALLARTTGQRIYGYFALHALAVGLLALTFPPVAPSESATEFWHMAARMAAEGSVIGTAGLLMAHLILPAAPNWLRRPVRAIAPIGLVIVLSSAWFPAVPYATAIYGALVLSVLLTMMSALVICTLRHSTDARFLLIAFTPLIAVGCLAAIVEALLLPSISFYAEGMLLGFVFELLFVFTNLAGRLRDAVRERDLAVIEAEQARAMSETDPLTGLANRRVFDRQLRTDPGSRFAAIAVLDCDRFKLVNDRFGHANGDEVLRIVGRELQSIDGMAMRIGGEEFGLLLSGEDWAEQLERIRLSIPFAVMDKVQHVDMPVTVSIGAIAFASGVSAEVALLRADEALYVAKEAGRDRVVCVREARDSDSIMTGRNSRRRSDRGLDPAKAA